MKRLRIVLITAMLLLAAAAALHIFMTGRREAPSRVTLSEALIASVKSMLRLCSLEFYDEVPVRGSVGSRHIFARTTLTGSVGFDLDSLECRMEGDTLVVVLPPEVVEIREAAEPDAYRVFDTWNDHLLGSSVFTTAEENAIKAKVIEGYRRRVYARGYVDRARREAAESLSGMLTALTGGPVRVSDPGPAH